MDDFDLDTLPRRHTTDPSEAVSTLLPLSVQPAEPWGLLYYWLKLCSYTSNSVLWRMIMCISIVSALALEYMSAVWNDPHSYDHIVEIAYVICTLCTFVFLQRNLNHSTHSNCFQFCSSSVCCQYYCAYRDINIFLSGFNCKFVSYVIICVLSFIAIRFSIFTKLFCAEAATWDHVLGHIAAFYVNMTTMYTLDFVICNICLAFVQKFNTLKEQIKIGKDVEPQDVKDLQGQVSAMVDRWKFVVSVSLFYHFMYPTVIVSIWLFTKNVHLWQYCSSNSLTQLIIISTRSILRIYALFYGILTLNHEYDALAKVISTELRWNQATSTKAGRMALNLSELDDRFKICWCITIRGWKRFTLALAIWAVGIFIAAVIGLFVKGAVVHF